MVDQIRFYLLIKEAGLDIIPEHRDKLHKFMQLTVNECALVAQNVVLGDGKTYRDEMYTYFSLKNDV